MSTPAWLRDRYSNCTTAYTVASGGPVAPSASPAGRARVNSDMPSGQSEKNGRARLGTEVSRMGLPLMST
ncbi:hypothetical protein D3C87_1572230 [compost metagenome]